MHHPNPTSARQVPPAPVGHRRRRPRLAPRPLATGTLAALAALAIVLLPGASLPHATAVPAPDPAVLPAAVSFITEPAPDAFVPRNSLTVAGTGTTVGNAVTVSLNGAVACATTVTEPTPGELVWSCAVAPVADGAGQRVTAVEQLAAETRADERTVHVLGPPTIDAATPTTGVVSGTGLPGATVAVTLPGGAGGCATAVTAGRYWSCTPATSPGVVAASGVYAVSAAQSHPAIGPAGSYSRPASRTIEIDTIRPAPPHISAPRGDYRIIELPTTFRGTGEAGATVDAYIDGVPVCTATVSATLAWSCVGGAGTSASAHRVTAIQRDIAGNHSDPTAPMRVFFGPRAAEAAPVAVPTPSSPALAFPPSTPAPSQQPTYPYFVDAVDREAALTNWGSPTAFGAALPTPQESLDRGNWWRAPLLALGTIVLIALPLRLLATSLRGRIRLGSRQITGRNRQDVTVEESQAVGVNPWLAGFAPFAVAVAFVAISSGVGAEVRYLRLAFAVAVALTVLNVVGVAAAARIGYRHQGIDGRLRFRPSLLIAAIVLGLLSRASGLIPPLAGGAIIGVRFAAGIPARKRALASLTQVGMMLALGLVGWVGHGLLGPVVGFWPSLLAETLAALCLAGLGSTLVLMLPLASLPGRIVMEWSPWVWAATSFLVATIGFAVILGGPGAHFPLGVLLLAVGGLAAVCVAAWTGLRFVGRGPEFAAGP